ncbi:DUF5723 family protein [Spongiivirga citrea]|uniref:OmpA family protein n=1 Tax=Spongiivirga citrea TaxID=1481457 RepID=A0A6M0CD57_9FLAO|nr:DUF5723 family protein [Spongiivirga citrea]NER15768.1 OmpA family protein [Spongiivirga citrea]
MKKLFFISVLSLFSASIFSQSYIGFLSDNYKGVHGVVVNPATIVDTPYKADINLASLSGLGDNDYYGVSFSDLLKSDFDFERDAIASPSDANSYIITADVLGPSFMFNIKPKHSVAVFTRARLFANVNDINGELFETVTNDFDSDQDFVVNANNFFGTTHGWGEVGVSYATVLMDKGNHFLTGGVSFKYLQGLGNAYAEGDVNLNYDADGTAPNIASYDSSGAFTYGRSSNLAGDLENIELVDGANGFGADVGFSYEYRPDGTGDTHGDPTRYKLKVGLSVTDIGSLSYKNSTQALYNLNAVNISEADFDSVSFEDAIRNVYTFQEADEDLDPRLPTAAHLFVDYKIVPKIYINANVDYSLVKSATRNSSSVVTNAFITPRYESKWFSFYMPVGYKEYSGFSWGSGFRFGPLFVGSGSILSNVINDESQGVDVYAGLKVPLYRGKPRDKDGDGIVDKEDACPETPGPIENGGCPWPDRDEDGVYDKDDKCPDEPGRKDNEGCPILDKDGDGVNDDVDICPDVAGDPENNGCPWPDTDGDGVYDNDDDCPNTAGTVAGKGCPEVTEEVVEQLNEYGKTILFDPDKSSFKNESFTVLQEMTAVMKQYPSARFRLEGHTDSRGEEAMNQRLSELRVNAVRDYLIKNGIDASRLEAVGLGEKFPVATNMYMAGRKQNRRVEIKLIN